MRGQKYYGTDKTPLLLPVYADYNPPFSYQNLVNIYPVQQVFQGVKNYIYKKMKGTEFFLGFNEGEILDFYVFRENLFIATKKSLLKVLPDWTFVKIGTIPNATKVEIKSIFDGLVLRIDSEIYTHTTENADPLVVASDTDLVASDGITTLNNSVFSIIQNDLGQFQFSAFNDATSWDALNYATAEYQSDKINKIETFKNDLILFGEETIEYWTSVGGDEVVASRSISVDVGCDAPDTVSATSSEVFFLGKDSKKNLKSIYISSSSGASDIGSDAIKKALSGLDTKNAYGFNHTEEGIEFYTFVIPDVTAYSFCIKTKSWIERRSYQDNEFCNDIKIKKTIYFNNKSLCILRGGVSLFEIKGDKFENEIMPWEIITPYFSDKPNTVNISEVTLDIAAGAGDIELTYSKDDGRTYSHGMWRTAPEIGQKNMSLSWRRLGQFERALFRFRGFEKCNIIGGYVGI